jgi:hypothetical protein
VGCNQSAAVGCNWLVAVEGNQSAAVEGNRPVAVEGNRPVAVEGNLSAAVEGNWSTGIARTVFVAVGFAYLVAGPAYLVGCSACFVVGSRLQVAHSHPVAANCNWRAGTARTGEEEPASLAEGSWVIPSGRWRWDSCKIVVHVG